MNIILDLACLLFKGCLSTLWMCYAWATEFTCFFFSFCEHEASECFRPKAIAVRITGCVCNRIEKLSTQLSPFNLTYII